MNIMSKWIDKDTWDFEKSFVDDTISRFDAFKQYNMKQKVIVYNVNLDSSIFFSSYEDVAKHLDCKVDKLKRIADTEEKINNVYLIRRCI